MSEIKADDNVIQTFQLEGSNLRGRLVRLGSVLDDILGPHDYPRPAAHLVAETISLSLLLSSMLKYDGIFTLQTSGDGPIRMLVADVTSPEWVVRGCASFDEERLEHAREQLSALQITETSHNQLAQYLGKGHIAFTVDQGNEERYQGIVDLHGASLVDCVQHYFNQSEQIGTGIKMAVGQRDGKWRAGGIMLQHMPESGANQKAGRENTGEDDWRRSMILLETCTDDEFLDAGLHPHDLLTRLFHEEGVRVFEPVTVKKGCRCSAQKIENMLAAMSEDDVDYMDKDGTIAVRCEFCSHDYEFDSKKIRATLAKP